MKLSKLLYLSILPFLITPSLNASKDSQVETNVQSVFFEESFDHDKNKKRSRALRECESANRYLEKELYVMEDNLTRTQRRMKRMQAKIRDYEAQLEYYQKRAPRRPRAAGYGDGRNRSRNGYKYRNY
ncbi:MAG: hypothetical protein R8P61_19355 [Bacteroidia bacterium]|nr:hypothetical protein [Bacteroidia bacterium]